MLEDKFKTQIDKYKIENQKYIKQNNIVGYLRLATVIAAIIPVYIYAKYNTVNVVSALLPIALFIGLVIYHSKVKEKQKFVEDMISINEDCIKRINGQWIEFEDCGEEFIDKKHPYSFDLDLFGKDSLFQLINVTNTYYGRKKLSDSMKSPAKDKTEIIKRQNAVEELSSKLEFCEKVQYAGKITKGKEKNPEKLMKYFRSSDEIAIPKFLKKIVYVLPLITIPLSIAIIVFKISSFRWFIGTALIIQILLWLFRIRELNRTLASIDYISSGIKCYLNIINVISEAEFDSELMKNIKFNLSSEGKSAISAIKKLYKISERVNARNGGIQYLFLNVLLLWDYQCALSLESWKVEFGTEIEGWMNDIGTVEELISISMLSHISENTVFPDIVEGEKKIEAVNLGHPLIDSKVRINNDVNMKDNMFIITGSNMSGKTTYLRTIGINLVIAYLGGKVEAESMSTSILEIYTSMRISDDLKNGISTFYGELIRIKEIISRAQKESNLVFFIDEIFRGTNSKDRIAGAEAVIKNLNKVKAIGAMTTHDLELCRLSDNMRIKNYHFEEFYKENKINFDYKLREGISTKTNAKYLMKIVGIDI